MVIGGTKRTVSVLSLFLLIMVVSSVSNASAEECLNVADFSGAENSILSLVLENLTTQSTVNDREIIGSLAESWQFLDNKNVLVELRRGVRFTNGEDFNTDTVITNLKYQLKHSSYRGVTHYISDIREIKKLSKYKFILQLKKPNTAIMHLLGTGVVLSLPIGAPKYMKKVGWNEFLQKPIGTGPFLLRWMKENIYNSEEGELIAVLDRNSNYRNSDNVKLKCVNFYYYRHEPNAREDIINGKLDLFRGLRPADAIKVSESKTVKVLKVNNGANFDAAFNMRKPSGLLKDIEVRRAINMAVNKPELLKYAYSNYGALYSGVTPPGFPGHNPQLKPTDYNLEKSISIFKEKGLHGKADFNIIGTSDTEPVLKVVTNMLRATGLNASYSIVTFKEIEEHVIYPVAQPNKYRADKEKWDVFLYQLGYWTLHPISFHCVLYAENAPARWTIYDNQDYYDNYNKMVSTLDVSEQDKYAQMLESIIHNGHYRMELFSPYFIYAVSKYVEGFKKNPVLKLALDGVSKRRP